MMPEIIDIKPTRNPSTTTAKFYRFEDPNPPPPLDYYGLQEIGDEYHGFVIVRMDRQTLLWEVKNKDFSDPPGKLQGHFTSQTKAKEYIDYFIKEEQKKAMQVREANAMEVRAKQEGVAH